MPDALELFHPYTSMWFKAALGSPTPVQEAAWPAIAAGGHTLVSAPTGTGKTLSAFLVFIDRLKAEARAGTLKKELRLIYVSPLKALAGDIRENLARPLNGVRREELKAGEDSEPLSVAVRTGDTSAADRRRMLKHPPHILITTPESLYLLLTAVSGREMLKTARAVIIDELHAMIDSKRGAHLTLSLARLDDLCGKPLQRVALSATIDPLSEAAAYLAADAPVTIAAPAMRKEIKIEVISPVKDFHILPQNTIWPEIARAVCEQCYGARSVIAFVDGRMSAEKLAYQVNLLAGDDFARTHHGCVSKEQRQQAEHDLRAGRLRLLVATSSMELGIDVGEIDRVVQIAYPRSISSLLQRLGRAGHNPGRVSVMSMFPKTAAEGLYCGLTADAATRGGIEKLRPPRVCLDVLAQHLVSMAAGGGYTVDGALALARRAYPFKDITREDVEGVLAMLAGDYEHNRDIPARPRVLYDRVNGRVDGDAYSRMLAVSGAGTIPDTGQFAAKTEDGVKIGELDEEFVFEQRVGYKFMLGSFAWKITAMNRDTVTVTQSTPEGAEPPFWRNARLARKTQTGAMFGGRLRELTEAAFSGGGENGASEPDSLNMDAVIALLRALGLDGAMAVNTAGVILRQIEATGMLPDDRTVIAEHFTGEAGEHQIMLHSVFGWQVNAPLSILLQEAARRLSGADADVFADDDGILLSARGRQSLPEGLLQHINPASARTLLEAVLPGTPLFNMTFRYNAGRALMMGVRKAQRQPLWVQRLRAAEMLDSVVNMPEHPLIRETRRECLEDYWDLPGLERLLNAVRGGEIRVRELYRAEPSPLSLPLRRAAEANYVYDYHPGTSKINQAAADALNEAQKLKPAAEQLAKAQERKKPPENEQQLHSLLMMEGDVTAGELTVPYEWFETLAAAGRALYIEPGLWIAAEQAELYAAALAPADGANTETDVSAARAQAARRALRYRGPHTAAQLAARYVWPPDEAADVLRSLAAANEAVIENDGVEEIFYHASVYEYARRETIYARRKMFRTRPARAYAALLTARLRPAAPPAEQLSLALDGLRGRAFPPALWEGAILPARVNNYRPALLDNLLSNGGWFWRMGAADGAFGLSFHRSDEIDWECDMPEASSVLDGLPNDERRAYDLLLKRGASFAAAFGGFNGRPVDELLLSLAEKGLARADSFVPARQWLNQEKTERAAIKQRVSARVLAQTSGRWELNRPLKPVILEEQLERAFAQSIILCRETAAVHGINWAAALERLRVWEYTGRARRGYFVEGLSGAQYIHERDYERAILALERFDENENNENDETNETAARGQTDRIGGIDEIIWLSAADPAQPWGRLLAHTEGRAFLCVQGTAAAFYMGLPVAVFERNGEQLRVFDDSALAAALAAFVRDYAAKRIFPERRRVTVKHYPPEAAAALERAGFTRVMMDYALYQGQ